ncbi:MAG: nucleotidyltransferase domain-containing protein [archaeon]
MLTKEEIKIIDLFRKDLFRSYTIREIMKRTSKKSYPWTFNSVRKMEKMGLIDMAKKGYSNICSLSLDNSYTITYLAFLDELEANSRKLPRDNIIQLINAVPLSYFTFMVAGSYAAGKATEKSDIDVVVLAEDGTETKKILTILKNKGELMVPEAHPYVFTKTEFLNMLLNEEQNYGKLIFKNRIIFFGAENYYLIVKKAIKNGFKG